MRGSSAGRRCSAGARQCALRRGLREPAAAPVVCAQVPPNKEVAKGVVHVGQRQEHVKHAGTRMQARAPLQPTRTMVRLAQESAGSSSGGQDGAQPWQLEGSNLPGKTCKHGRSESAGREGANLKCSRHICAKHGSAGQCAWQACLPPPDPAMV